MSQLIGRILGAAQQAGRRHGRQRRPSAAERRDPTPQEVEAGSDEAWLKKSQGPPAEALVAAWRRTARPGTADAEAEAGALFRSTFSEVFPTLPQGTAPLPLCFLLHFASALRLHVDEMARMDSSLPRTGAEERGGALESCLDCLRIACAHTINVRPLIDSGLLSTLSTAIDALACVIEPLARQMRCLHEPGAEQADDGSGPRSDALISKAAQVGTSIHLRARMVAHCTELLQGLAEARYPQQSGEQDATALRRPVSPPDMAAAMRAATPDITSVVSHALRVVLEDAIPVGGADGSASFNAARNLIAVLRFVAQNPDLDADTDTGSALLQCLRWPRECSFRHSRSGGLAADVRLDAACGQGPDLDAFVTPDVDRGRLVEYSQLQRDALFALCDVISHTPHVAPQLLAMGLVDRVAESSVWHVTFFSSPSAAAEIGGRLLERLPSCCDPGRPSPAAEDFFPATAIGSRRTLLSVAAPQPKPLADVLDIVGLMSGLGGTVRELASGRFTSRHKAAEERRRAAQSTGSPEAGQSADIEMLFDAADRLEFLALGLYDGLFYGRPVSHVFNVEGHLSPRSSRGSATITAPPSDLAVGLHLMRDRCELQLLTLSMLTTYLQIQEQDSSDIASSISGIFAGSAQGPRGIRARGGRVQSSVDVIVPLGVHRVLLESELGLFYFSAFDGTAGKTREHNLRPRWEGCGPQDAAVLCFMRRCCCSCLSFMARLGGRDVRPDLAAVLDVLRRFRYSVEVVIDMAQVLLSKRGDSDALPPLLAAAKDDDGAAQMLVDVVVVVFQAVHSVTNRLQQHPAASPESDGLPCGVREADLQQYRQAKQLVLRVLDQLLAVPAFQLALLSGEVALEDGRQSAVNVLLHCLQDPAHRVFAKTQIHRILLHVEPRTGRSLDLLLQPLTCELCVAAAQQHIPRDLAVEILNILKDALRSLETDERQLLLATTEGDTAKREAATRRRRALQGALASDSRCYLLLVSCLSHNELGAISTENYCLTVVELLGCAIKGNAAARKQFHRDVGWAQVSRGVVVALAGAPVPSLFDVFLDILVEDTFGNGDGVTIQNEHALPVVLNELFPHPMFAEQHGLLLRVATRICRALDGSTHNLACAASVDAFDSFVSLLVKFEQYELRDQICRCLESVGRHSVTVKQLKHMFVTFKDQPPLLPWLIRVLHKLAQLGPSAAGQAFVPQEPKPPSVGPPTFFDFSALHSGLKVEKCSGFPGSNGYTIAMWMRVEAHEPKFLRAVSEADEREGALRVAPSFNAGAAASQRRTVVGPLQALQHQVTAFEPRLWSFLWQESGAHLEAFMRDARLYLSVAESGRATKQVERADFVFEEKRWYHLTVTHTPGRMMRHAKVHVYVDGVERMARNFHYLSPKVGPVAELCVATNSSDARRKTLRKSMCGQISCVYFLDTALAAPVVRSLHQLGPLCQSNFAAHERDRFADDLSPQQLAELFGGTWPASLPDTRESVASRLCILLNPLAHDGDTGLINAAELGRADEGADVMGQRAQVLEGTQLCATLQLHQALDCLGGIKVVFPLLALLGGSDTGLGPVLESGGAHALEPRDLLKAVTRFLRLLIDLVRQNPKYLLEMQSCRLVHVLSMLLAALGPHLRPDNVRRICDLLTSMSGNEDLWRDGVTHLLLDLSIWSQSGVDTQKELFVSLQHMMGSEHTRKRLREIRALHILLEQMCWYYYYEGDPGPRAPRSSPLLSTPSPPASPGRLRSELPWACSVATSPEVAKERLQGRTRTLTGDEVRVLRDEAAKLFPLLLSDPVAPEDVSTFVNALVNPHQDMQQLADLLDSLVDLIAPDAGGGRGGRKATFLDILVRDRGAAVLLELLRRPLAGLRQAALRCLGVVVRYSKRLLDGPSIRDPTGLSLVHEALSKFDLDKSTYRALREVALGQVHRPQQGSMAASTHDCPLLQNPQKVSLTYEVPCAVIAMLQLGSAAPLDVKLIIARDLHTVVVSGREPCAAVAEMAGWQSVMLDLLEHVQDTSGPDVTLCSELLLSCTARILYHSLLTADHGWKEVDFFISALADRPDLNPYEVEHGLLHSLVDLYLRDLKLGPFPPPEGAKGSALSNVAYLILFLEDHLCYNDSVRLGMEAHRQLELASLAPTKRPSAATQHAVEPPLVVSFAEPPLCMQEEHIGATADSRRAAAPHDPSLSRRVSTSGPCSPRTPGRSFASATASGLSPAREEETVMPRKCSSSKSPARAPETGADYVALLSAAVAEVDSTSAHGSPTKPPDSTLSQPERQPSSRLLGGAGAAAGWVGGDLVLLRGGSETTGLREMTESDASSPGVRVPQGPLAARRGDAKSRLLQSISPIRTASDLTGIPSFAAPDGPKEEAIRMYRELQRRPFEEGRELSRQDRRGWRGWSLALKTLSILFRMSMFKVHEFAKELDTTFQYRRPDSPDEVRQSSYLARPGGLCRVCVRLLRLCLSLDQAPPLLSAADVSSPETVENMMQWLSSLIRHDESQEKDRERFEDLYTSGRRLKLAHESRMRTLVLVHALAEFLGRARRQNEHAKSDERRVLKQLQITISQRQNIIMHALSGSDKSPQRNHQRGGKPAAEIAALEDTRSAEQLLRSSEWRRLHPVLQKALQEHVRETASVWVDITERRRCRLVEVRKVLASVQDRRQRVHGRAQPPLPRPDESLPHIRQMLRDSARVADKFWKVLLLSVTNERGAWSVPRSGPVLVKRCGHELGAELWAQVRMKLRRDPRLTDHSDITQQGSAGDDVSPKRGGAAMHGELGDDADDDGLCETVDGDDAPDEEVPSAGSTLKLPCELVCLMQDWSAVVQVVGSRRYLSLAIDEENTAVTQTVPPAAEHLVEKPRDDSFPLDTITDIVLRRYRHQWTALEFYFTDRTSMLINLRSARDAHTVVKFTMNVRPRPKALRTQVAPPKRPRKDYGAQEVKNSGLQARWLRREISNFDYLMGLNFFASRTFNDLSQYPIMPWIIANYTAESLDLEDRDNYRDLRYPVQILGGDGRFAQGRAEELSLKYESLVGVDIEPPFHCGTNYSSASYVLSYLIRMEPYSSGHVVLQGAFDHADRLFHSVPQTWYGVTHSSGDVKELVPEFFCQPEMFVNNNRIRFGTRQDGAAVDHAVLPPWAADEYDFVRQNREALESETVSLTLHLWIDLIFGYRQLGKGAVEMCNVYRANSYERWASRRLQTADEADMQSVIHEIAHFGQVPHKLFSRPHPARTPIVPLFHPFRSQAPTPVLQRQTIKHHLGGRKDKVLSPVVKLYFGAGDLIAIRGNGEASVHPLRVSEPLAEQDARATSGLAAKPPKRVPWGFSFDPSCRFMTRPLRAGMMRAEPTTHSYAYVSLPERELLFCAGLWDYSATISEVVTDGGHPVVVQSLTGHKGVVTCLTLADDNSHLVTGSTDTTLILWSLRTAVRAPPFAQLKATLYGHDDEVTCAAICTDLDVVASGSKDGTVVLYSVSDGRYERTLEHPDKCPVDHVAICPVFGAVAFSSREGLSLHLFSINGQLLAAKQVEAPLRCLTASRDGRYFLTGSAQFRSPRPTLVVWASHNLEVVRAYEGAEKEGICSIALHRDNQIVVVGLDDGSLLFYGVI